MRTFTINDFYFLLDGALWTIWLSLASLACGGILGALICAMRLSRFRALRLTAGAIVQVGQGVPPLVQIFLAYFGLAALGLELPPFLAAAIALSFFAAVYLGEIWRSAVQAIPQQQWEAAESLALTRTQQMTCVIAPQALRFATPPTIGLIVQLVKNTSLASIVGMVELTRSGQLVNNATFESFKIFGLICVIYFCICFPISRLSRLLENRMRVAR